MIQLHAQPYDLSATGFYFESVEEFDAKASKNRNDYGQQVEEYEIQFIEGEAIDCALAEAIGINQANFREYLEIADTWMKEDKRLTVVAVGECGYDFDPDVDPSRYKVELCGAESLRELAEQFVEEGVYGDIPEPLQFYIDYDAIARDLAVEFCVTTVAGVRFSYASY